VAADAPDAAALARAQMRQLLDTGGG